MSDQYRAQVSCLFRQRDKNVEPGLDARGFSDRIA